MKRKILKRKCVGMQEAASFLHACTPARPHARTPARLRVYRVGLSLARWHARCRDAGTLPADAASVQHALLWYVVNRETRRGEDGRTHSQLRRIRAAGGSFPSKVGCGGIPHWAAPSGYELVGTARCLLHSGLWMLHIRRYGQVFRTDLVAFGRDASKPRPSFYRNQASSCAVIPFTQCGEGLSAAVCCVAAGFEKAHTSNTCLYTYMCIEFCPCGASWYVVVLCSEASVERGLFFL